MPYGSIQDDKERAKALKVIELKCHMGTMNLRKDSYDPKLAYKQFRGMQAELNWLVDGLEDEIKAKKE